jgi:hypothetical protein
MPNRADTDSGYARYLSNAVLYVDAHETWKVGEAGQTVSQYLTITASGLTQLSDATTGITAQAIAKTPTGYLLFGVSNADLAMFYSATVNTSGVITDAQALSTEDLLTAETKLWVDLNGNGGIGDRKVLLNDGMLADLYADGLGHLLIKGDLGAFTPLHVGGKALTQAALGDALSITQIVPSSAGFQVYLKDDNGSVYEAGVSASGAATGAVRLLSAAEEQALESSVQADLNQKGDTPAPSGWTSVLKVSAIREKVDQLGANGQKIGHAGLVSIVDAAIASLGADSATVSPDVIGDLRAIAMRGKALFASTSADGSTHGDYLSDVFGSLVGSSAANNFYTGGQKQATALGNLSSESTVAQLKQLEAKWLLGLDNPNPTIEGDSANPNASAASGVYKTFEGSLFVDGISFADVAQGSAGTCYLLAVAAAFAQDRPSLIKQLFVDNGVSASGVHTYGVRLFDAQGVAHWVTVSNQFAVKDMSDTEPLCAKLFAPGTSGTPELWMALLEKAYAQMNETGLLERDGANNGKNALFAIENGGAEPGIFLGARGVVGYATDVLAPVTVNGVAGYEARPVPAGNTALAEVAKYVNGGQAVWISSEKVTQDAAGKTLFTNGHAYMAYDADPGNPTNTSVQVFNPWGATSAASDAGYVAPFAADLAQIVGVTGFEVYMFGIA